jgi:pyridoxine/pyridoxamine 5'-phosphate oxidase
VDVASFEEIAAEFRRRIEQTTWCTLTTVDSRGRPRGRIVHPVWEEPVGWLATFLGSCKATHLKANPWVSLAYWDQQHEQVYADGRATWIDDEAQKTRLWDLYNTKPEGYELSGFWEGAGV